MQITVFFTAYTKKSLKFRKHSCFAYVISRISEKILDNVFQSNYSSHAELLTNLRKIEKQPKIRHRLVNSVYPQRVKYKICQKKIHIAVHKPIKLIGQ